MRNIFKALDGGHLDDALFGTRSNGPKSGTRDAKNVSARETRRSRLPWVGKSISVERKESRSAARPDSGQ